jgi:hypothetical protein
MTREAPRTLLSLSATYQRYIDPADYEIIVVDNGSSPPLDRKLIERLSGNFRLVRVDPPSPSPVPALNLGFAEARGDVIGVMIDGARITTPGLLHFARHGARLYERALVATLGWYLGFDHQRWAMQAGYNQLREDALLASINWPENGYRLFEIATFDESSTNGWFAPITESNALFMRRVTWNLLGSIDERFASPGGGLVNLDIFRRAVELEGAELVILLGEATFHQVHGGVATNIPFQMLEDRWVEWANEYQKIRGEPYEVPRQKSPTYIGTLPSPVLANFTRAALYPFPQHPAPLGPKFDKVMWSTAAVTRSNSRFAAIIDLARAEFAEGNYPATAAIARLIRERAPDEPEPLRLLSLVAGSHPSARPPSPPNAVYHAALGDAYRLLGESDLAVKNYRAALAIETNLARALIGLATLRMCRE